VIDAALLSWLPRPPEGFRVRCTATDTTAPRGAALRALAGYALGANQLHRLARSVAQAVEDGAAAPLQGFTLGLVSNATTDFIVPALVASALRYGIALRVAAAPFGMTLQAALDAASEPLASRPDAILLALDYRAYFPEYALEDDASARLDAALARLGDLVTAFSRGSGAAILVQTIAAPPERLFGSFDRDQSGTAAWLAASFNQRLSNEILRPGVSFLDVEALASQVGLAAWFDRSQHMAARLPFAHRFVPLYAEHAARLIGAIRGRGRKVLVLDLDNTLWGGVIGDDGIEGIRLGQGDPRGEAHLDLQRAALALKRRGILLAIASKNDEAVARRAIREHPEMLLREDDFSAMQINWSDKASNLEALAERLSLGIDSFVFLDDNPAERAQVRLSLPEVLVPELPSDPADYAAVLLAAGGFEAVAFSDEDRQRADQYAANSRRESLATHARDLAGFLESLQMHAIFTADGVLGWSRFTQLINKSNQFNLTTRRYTEARIADLVAAPDVLTLQVRLVDRFGDNGMICSVIACPRDDAWMLDTWVMSCRVLGRRVEEAVLNEIIRRARAAGVARLIGLYRPTPRNALVRNHYRTLGFVLDGEEDDAERWVLDVATYRSSVGPIVSEISPAA